MTPDRMDKVLRYAGECLHNGGSTPSIVLTHAFKARHISMPVGMISDGGRMKLESFLNSTV